MQPISYGSPQQLPMYPNCFDALTTHGIVADDVVGYITDAPSPYLQGYVAQRGWAPNVPGQVLPDPLPTLPPKGQLPKGDVYQGVAKPNENTFVKKNKYETAKKVALACLLAGLAVFGVMKGKQCFSWIKNKFTHLPTPPAPPAPVATPVPSTPSAPLKFYQKAWNWFSGKS